MSEHTPDEDWKVLNDWACSPETTELDHKADAFSEHPDLSIFTPKSAAKGFYVGWVTGYAKALSERDEARAMVKELVEALRDQHWAIVHDNIVAQHGHKDDEYEIHEREHPNCPHCALLIQAESIVGKRTAINLFLRGR